MKILVLHNQLWSQYKSIIFEKINNYCLKNGDELLVLQTSICEYARRDLIDFDINNFNYKYKFVLLNNKYLESTNSFVTTFKWLKYIFKFKPDIVNLTGYSEPGTLFMLLVCKSLKIKTIITNESVFYFKSDFFGIISHLKYLYKRIIFYFADYFFSYGLKSNDFLFRHKVDKHKILSFLNAFDSERFKGFSDLIILNKERYFLFVGRISFEKNIDFLIELAIKLKNNSSNITVKIIGNGPEYDRLAAKIKMLNLNNIELLGSIKWDNLAYYYTKSLGLILPSFFEPWGMVANEAFFYNIPVICSKFCGCADDLVINKYNGIVLQDFSFGLTNNDFNIFLSYFLNLRDELISNIKLTNYIFEPDRLSSEQYLSIKRLL